MKMSGFKQYINEDIYNITPITAAGSVDIRNPDVIDQINITLTKITGDKFITPYVAFEKVQKALAGYMIFPTKPLTLGGDSGLFTWPISQFGDKSGQKDDGTMLKSVGIHGKDETHGPHTPGESFHGGDEKSIEKKDEETHHLYFEYRLSDCGMFNIFTEIVDDDELEELLGDLEDEMNDEEEESDDLQEENLQELSKGKLRKYIDRSMSDWHHQDMTAKYANTDKERALGKLKKANRAKGISRAIDKEEGKNLQELSKATLKSYIRQAADDKTNLMATRMATQNKWMMSGTKRIDSKMNNRDAGIERALNKLEEQPLQELSRGKLADYVAASSTDMSNRLKKSHQELSNATTRFNRDDKPEAVQAHSDAADKEYKKASKRQAGIYKAVKRLAK